MPTVFQFGRQKLLSAVAAVALISGCATVDLGDRYQSPQVRIPQSALPAPNTSPITSSSVAVAQPVVPAHPVTQPLPPIGSARAPLPVAPASAESLPRAVDPVAEAALVTLTTQLEGAAVIPPTLSHATGRLDALYDTTKHLLRWKASWSGLSGTITGVQFHGPAGMDQNGPAAMRWPGPYRQSYEGMATLTEQQARDLVQGRWYVSVMTSAYPSGELRGQLHVVY